MARSRTPSLMSSMRYTPVLKRAEEKAESIIGSLGTPRALNTWLPLSPSPAVASYYAHFQVSHGAREVKWFAEKFEAALCSA